MKKLLSTRRGKTIVALICSLVLLATAATAGYLTAGGYVVYKDALKGLASRDRYDLTANISLDFMGNSLGAMTHRELYDSQGQVIAYQEHGEDNSGHYDSRQWYERNENRDYKYKETAVYSYDDTWTINNTDYMSVTGGIFGELFGASGNDKQAQRIMKLAESALDLVVGDLKNNFVATGSDGNGGQSYRIVLSHDQLPEVIRSGIDVVFGEFSDNRNDPRILTDYDAFDAVPAADGSFDPWEQEKDAREAAYAAMDRTGDNFVVLHADGSYTLYPTYADYYKSGEFDLSRIHDLDDVFALMADTPRVKTAQCDFTVDKYGQLTANHLYGELSFTDLAGRPQSVSLTIDLAVKDLTGPIPGPGIPADASIIDYSIGNSENGWAYSVTKNGVTVMKSQAEDTARTEQEWLMELSSVERVQFLFSLLGSEDIDYDRLAEAEKFGTSLDLTAELARLMLDESRARTMDDYAQSCGLAPDTLWEILQSDVEALKTGANITCNAGAFGADAGVIGGADDPTVTIVSGGN